MTRAGILSAAEGVIVRRGQKVRPASERRPKLRRNLGALLYALSATQRSARVHSH